MLCRSVVDGIKIQIRLLVKGFAICNSTNELCCTVIDYGEMFLSFPQHLISVNAKLQMCLWILISSNVVVSLNTLVAMTRSTTFYHNCPLIAKPAAPRVHNFISKSTWHEPSTYLYCALVARQPSVSLQAQGEMRAHPIRIHSLWFSSCLFSLKNTPKSVFL